MLIKLTPEQIINNWEAIHFSLIRSLPPIAEYRESGIIEIKKQLLKDTMQCWTLLDKNEKIQAVATTTLTSDIGTGVYNLLIYSLFAIANVSNEDWQSGFSSLKLYAREHGCKKIIAYSNVPRIIDLAQNFLGGKVDFQLISMEVNDG